MFKKIVSYLKGGKPDGEKEAGAGLSGAEGNFVEEKVVGEVPAVKNENDDAAAIENNAAVPASGETEDAVRPAEEAGTDETALSNTSVIVEAGAASDKDAGFQEKASQKSWFAHLKERLGKTKNSFVRKLGELFGDRMTIDEQTLERLEEILIEADIGVKTTQKIIKRMQEKLDEVKVKNMDELFALLRDIMTSLVDYDNTALNIDRPGMSVMLVVGVNGVGKTTTIGKIASNLVKEGKKVMMVAGDTFRAGAIEQAEIWARRVGIPIVKAQQNSDPAAVVFDAIKAGKARHIDVLIIDTAGRLHTKYNLMEELKKIRKIITREIHDAPHEILQVLDGTTGQNALIQAKTFNEAMGGITGIALTKLDGTAKGGIVISISDELKVPIKLIGIGEAIDDLKRFNGADFVRAIFEQ
ncbi:MAG TPA: signal recognition particle-docking protein FtsY [Candidatus Wallbacteria bacterium]|nr:signal recognition particle-docking protein FtsY [Candidatus Wallbacteria bacterium]